jgi:3D (Asp-Asp-Asp) domain-containing protein
MKHLITRLLLSVIGNLAITAASHGSPMIMTLIPAPAVIPKNIQVRDGRVLTLVDLQIRITQGGHGSAGMYPALRSSHPDEDVLSLAGPTNSAGYTRATATTRTQDTPSVVGSANPGIQTPQPATIGWLPARYASSFLVTCYVVSLETDFVDTPLVGPVNGLPAARRYHQGFLDDVRLQGSGVALDGTTLHYDGNGRYSIQSCPLTASGACAEDGQTVAVDPAFVTMGATITLGKLGQRQAQDTGGAIDGYHLDEYYGTRRAACLQAGRRTMTVDFVHY